MTDPRRTPEGRAARLAAYHAYIRQCEAADRRTNWMLGAILFVSLAVFSVPFLAAAGL